MRTTPEKPGRLDRKSKLAQKVYRVMRKVPFTPSAGRYNLTISHERKFIWFRVAKVGTRTILNHLRESGICLDVEAAGPVYYAVNSFDDYFKFAFVRNPWDRLVSCWNDKVNKSNFFKFSGPEYEKMQHFGYFVDYVSGLNIDECNRHIRSQSALIDLNNIDYLGRMETFVDDINRIFCRLGLNEKGMVPKNVTSGRKPYQEYYSKDLAEKVYQIYRKDIQIFGYRF